MVARCITVSVALALASVSVCLSVPEVRCRAVAAVAWVCSVVVVVASQNSAAAAVAVAPDDAASLLARAVGRSHLAAEDLSVACDAFQSASVLRPASLRSSADYKLCPGVFLLERLLMSQWRHSLANSVVDLDA